MRAVADKSVVVFLWVFFLFFSASFARAQETTLTSFKMKDQFNREYTENYFIGSIIVLIRSDKDGSKYNGLWSRAIRDSLKDEEGFDQIKFVAVADLRGVPFFLKGLVKGKFPKEKEKWALMDWKGHFAKTYQFEKKASNIVILDRNGALVHKTFGRELDQEKLQVILEKLRTYMKK